MIFHIDNNRWYEFEPLLFTHNWKNDKDSWIYYGESNGKSVNEESIWKEIDNKDIIINKSLEDIIVNRVQNIIDYYIDKRSILNTEQLRNFNNDISNNIIESRTREDTMKLFRSRL